MNTLSRKATRNHGIGYLSRGIKNHNSKGQKTICLWVYYREKNTIKYTTWEQNGLLHRTDGPAFINKKEGRSEWLEFWTDGRCNSSCWKSE